MKNTVIKEEHFCSSCGHMIHISNETSKSFCPFCGRVFSYKEYINKHLAEEKNAECHLQRNNNNETTDSTTNVKQHEQG